MDRAHDVTEFRIDAILKEMSVTPLCLLPEDEPYTVDDFLDNTQVWYSQLKIYALIINTF